MSELKTKLEDRGIEIEEFEGTLNLSFGKGRMKSRANIEPKRSEGFDSHQLFFYVEGIHDVLKEPEKGIAKKWGFSQSAATLVPMVKTIEYVKGVEDAAGTPALNMPLNEKLALIFGVRWDRGTHIVTEAQFGEWGVTFDRVYAAARSMLYHFSEYATLKNVEGRYHTFSAFDGSDAARFLILEDKFFGDVNKGYLFALPTPDAFVFSYDKTDPESFLSWIQTRYSEEEDLLSLDVFSFQAGRLRTES